MPVSNDSSDTEMR